MSKGECPRNRNREEHVTSPPVPFFPLTLPPSSGTFSTHASLSAWQSGTLKDSDRRDGASGDTRSAADEVGTGGKPAQSRRRGGRGDGARGPWDGSSEAGCPRLARGSGKLNRETASSPALNVDTFTSGLRVRRGQEEVKKRTQSCQPSWVSHVTSKPRFPRLPRL